MARKSRHFIKIIEDDELLFETALRNRMLLRIASGSAMILVAGIFALIATIPIIAKFNMPLLWIELLNQQGWSKGMHEIGNHLIAEGKIMPFPAWLPPLFSLLSGVICWLGVHVIKGRRSPSFLGELSTASYWRHFYWLKKPAQEVSVNFHDIKKKP